MIALIEDVAGGKSSQAFRVWLGKMRKEKPRMMVGVDFDFAPSRLCTSHILLFFPIDNEFLSCYEQHAGNRDEPIAG